jgi:hypothetical protein
LEAGGLKALSDDKRQADINNPRGYYEWEPIKRIGEKPDLLDDEAITDVAIKCISMLLPQMPAKHDYKVMWMTRPIEEIAASQTHMVERLKKAAGLDGVSLRRALQAHCNEMRIWLAAAQNVEFIEIDYPTLVRYPERVLPRIGQFLSKKYLPYPEKMFAHIDASLYRERISNHSLA